MADNPFLYDVKVFDEDSGQLVGHLLRLSDDGLEMICDHFLEFEHEFDFELEDILTIEPGKKAHFSAVCDACRLDDANADLFLVHLTFTHKSPVLEEIAATMH